jgi:hypothetical protein
VVDALLEGLADAEHHGGGGAHAELVGGAVDADPVFGAALEAGDALADFVVEDLGAAAGDGIEAGVAQAHDGGAEVEVAVLGDGEDSDAERQCSQICGKRCLMPVKRRSNQSILRSGWMPPCMSTPVPPISTVSRNLLVDLLEVEDVAFAALAL